MRQKTAIGVHIFAGGFTTGVKAAGFKVLAHLEDTPYGVQSAAANFPGLDIRVGQENWKPEEFAGTVDFLYSNPPCAIFSSAGIATTRGSDSWRSDPRLGCWYRAFEVFKAIRPMAFALESVCQAYTKGREVVDEFTRKALNLGYSVTHLLEDAQWCGLPQSRRRFFFAAYRPWLPVEFRFDWSLPPTVGEVLNTITEPGESVDHCRGKNGQKYRQTLVATPQGCGLLEIYDSLGFGTERGPKGNIIGRPGFMYQRLHAGKTMGAFAGDFFVHPTEDRFLGIAEQKALCGYPPNFWLEGKPGGWASLLARAVLPPVGKWVASAIRKAFSLPRRSNPVPSVTLTDLRKPPGIYQDITETYRSVVAAAPVPATAVAAAQGEPALARPAVPIPRPSLKPRQLVNPAVVVANGTTEHPVPGEGSGQFIRRLWMTGRYQPEQLVALVHANWEGRTTKVGDIYYNYRRLVDSGVEGIPPWPGRTVNNEKVRVPKVATAVATTTVPGQPPVPRKRDSRPVVLLTGCTPIQCGSVKTQLQIITAMQGWYGALGALGYRVEWRPVEPGEDLSRYERVIVGVNKPNSIAAAYWPGAFWALDQRPDSIAAFDDWQVIELFRGFASVSRLEERMFRLRGNDLPWAIKDRLFALGGRIANREWPWQTIVPTLGSGDIGLLGIPGPGRVIGIDPTAFIRRYPLGPAVPKERKWVHASLLHKELPATTWPVENYGWLDRGKQGGGMSNSKGEKACPRLKEPELMAIYQSAWGVISPPHPHAGSSWWRVRYIMAADAGCILSANYQEAKCLGQPYEDASMPGAVEKLGLIGLTRLARQQREYFNLVTWPADRVLSVLSDLVKTP